MNGLSIHFLTLTEIAAIHHNQIGLYGGTEGVRDISLLSSAAAMPESSFEGKYLHADLFEMAAAYKFHICKDHPFIDGNKRTALAAALVFLDFNGIEIEDKKDSLYDAIMNIASGKMEKKSLAAILKKLAV